MMRRAGNLQDARRGRRLARSGRSLRVLAGGVFVLVGCGVAAVPGRAAADWLEAAQGRFERLGIEGTLAFSARVEGNLDLYSLGAGGPRRLTTHPAIDEAPAWSPDGEWIAFHSRRDDSLEIYIREWDRPRYRRLTTHAGFDGHPSWSPDGRTILFFSAREGEDEDDADVLFLVDANGENVRRLRIPGIRVVAVRLSWSPDGERFVIGGSRLPSSPSITGMAIYTVKRDGTGVRRLTSGRHFDMTPAWSPDGKQVAFSSDRGDNPAVMEIYVMAADGTGIRRLTSLGMQAALPAWSPDGKWIAFNAARQPIEWPTDPEEWNSEEWNSALFVVRADGSELVRLTDADVDCGFAAWRPRSGAER